MLGRAPPRGPWPAPGEPHEADERPEDEPRPPQGVLEGEREAPWLGRKGLADLAPRDIHAPQDQPPGEQRRGDEPLPDPTHAEEAQGDPTPRPDARGVRERGRAHQCVTGAGSPGGSGSWLSIKRTP